jgi:hypothetical protein
MLTPDYQEFDNRSQTEHRDNTVISGIHLGEIAEISQALRDCHATKRARKRNFVPVGGHRHAAGGQIYRRGRR